VRQLSLLFPLLVQYWKPKRTFSTIWNRVLYITGLFPEVRFIALKLV